MGSVLVVDDERSIRVTVKAFLEEDGHQVHTAEEVPSALAIIEGNPIDVVLTDIILPRLSGLDLLQKIRETSPDVRVIMMTGEPTLDTAAEALRFGAIDYLQKPVSKHEILKSVRNALRLKSLNDDRKRLEEENRRYLNQLEELVDRRTRALAESEASLRRRAWELDILNRLAREVGASMTVDATCRAGVDEIVKATGSDLVAVFLRDGERLVLRGLFPESFQRPWELANEHHVGECLCGLAVQEERPVFSENIHLDPRCTLEECRIAGFSSFTALPLKIGTEILGVLGLAAVNPRDFSSDGAFLEALANELSVGLKKSLLYEQLQQHASDLQASIKQIKKTEAERLKLQAQLQQSQKMEAIGTLAGGIAHDFNNILAAVLGYTELALGAVAKGATVHRYLSHVFDAALRARSLIHQILTFSRETGQAANPIQVVPIAKEALRLLRASLPATIEIRQDFQSESAVMADPTRIHQVLMNLCTNAAHAMRKKGGVLDVSCTDVFLDSDFTQRCPGLSSGPHLRLTVSDTGHGMSRFVVDRIFDPFFTTKRKGEGTGLGLSVVHGIVKGLNGQIMVYSSPGKGTSFQVFLPAICADGMETISSEEPIPTGAEHILLVDDEISLVEATTDILESLGYEITGMTNPVEALDAFRAEPLRFDMVITDMTMPQMTGDRLVEALLKIRPELPVILCSGFSASLNGKDAISMGLRALLRKPILKRDIAVAIRKAFDPRPEGC